MTFFQKWNCHPIYLKSNEFKTKLVLASKSPAAEISYDEHLAQKLFLKAVETGLSSESILSEIKSLLRDPGTSDFCCGSGIFS